MKISIVVPTLNNAVGLDRTLASIRMGGGSGVDVIVMDGGSEDETAEVIERHRDVISIFESGKDNGPYEAIAAGFERVAHTGPVTWLNAGDFLLPGALDTIAAIFLEDPGVRWLTGRRCVAVHGSIRRVNSLPIFRRAEVAAGRCKDGDLGCLQQEGMFWRKDLWDEAGGLNLSYQLAADFELWMRFARYATLTYVDIPIAVFSWHADNRSSVHREDYLAEVEQACDEMKTSEQQVSEPGRVRRRILAVGRRMPFIRRHRCFFPEPLETYDVWRWQSINRGDFVLKRQTRPLPSREHKQL